MRRRLDHVHDLEQRGVQLFACLQRITPIGEQHAAFHEQDGNAGGAGKSSEPGEPLLGRRYIFVLLAVGSGDNEAGEVAARQLGAQGVHARRARGRLGRVIERLEFGFEHGGNLLMLPAHGNASAQHQRRPAVEIDAP